MSNTFNRNENSSPKPDANINGNRRSRNELKSEIIRKLLHFSIALSPFLASINRRWTLIFLLAGVACWTIFEILRLNGVKVPLVSMLTTIASRPRDRGHFVFGPVTLGIGAFLALLLFSQPAASAAIYALAFGDGCAGLVGKFFGRHRPPFLFGKSIEGSLACFAAVFLASFLVLSDMRLILFSALTAMFAEAMPLEDFDNLVLPLAVGLVVQLA